jgi:ATP-dependent Lon protease
MYNNKGKDKSQIFHDKCYDKDIELDHITFFANVNYPEQLAPLLKNKIRMRRLESLSREEKKEILKIKKKEIVGSLQKIYPHENPTAVESLISEEFINQLVDYIQESGVRQSVRVLYKLEKDYINAKENGQEFSLGDPKQWLKNNVLAYRETFQPGKRHYFLFGL